MARARVDLPLPLSPTRPTFSPRSMREADAVDGAEDAGGREQARAAAGGSRARRRRPSSTGGPPGSDGSRLRHVRRGGEQLPRVGMGEGAEHLARSAPASTISPCRMTATSSARPATTARSWVMKIRPMPSSSTSRCSSSRMRAWVVTSSAVVGSSAISSFGRSAMAAAITTRWRWPPLSSCGIAVAREAVGAAGRRGRATRSASAQRLAAAHGACGSRMVSATWSPMVLSGSSAVIGSWNTIPMSLAADGAHLALGLVRADRRRRARCVPVGAAPARQQPHDRQRRHRLAGAGFADDAEDLAGLDAEVDAVEDRRIADRRAAGR